MSKKTGVRIDAPSASMTTLTSVTEPDPHPVERDGRSDVEPLERAVEVGDVRLPWSEEESVAAQHEHARDREEHGPDDERADDRLIRFATHGPRPSPWRRA